MDSGAGTPWYGTGMRQRRSLRWTPYNIAHIARHGVFPIEAEEAVDAAGLIEPSYGGRYAFIGPAKSGRILTVVAEPEGAGVYLVVTARPASRKERRRLAQTLERGA